MKRLIILISLSLFACKKESKKEDPQPIKTHIVDVAPTNFYTYVSINGTLQNSVQGARQYTCKDGDALKVTSDQFNPYVTVAVKVDGILLFQSKTKTDQFNYTIK